VNRFLPDERATVVFADAIYEALPRERAGWTFLLSGELGAGKSTFARALIRAAGHPGAIPSPTYTLVEPYNLATGNIYHVDLYRISSEEELRYLGWNELDDGLRIVEWPERAPELMATADLRFEFCYEGSARNVCIRAASEKGRALIQKIN
jgi:tRNA threonylcarbamoyladenosine biosynthesis protein TsaE